MSRGQDARELRRRALERTRWRAERELHDHTLDAWRTPGRRRALVTAWLATVAAAVAWTWSGSPPWSALVVFPALLAVSWRLRRVVRGLADLPEEWLGPGLTARRNRVYWLSYVTLISLLLNVLVAAWIASEHLGWSPRASHLEAFLWGFAGLSFALPSALLAWQDPLPAPPRAEP